MYRFLYHKHLTIILILFVTAILTASGLLASSSPVLTLNQTISAEPLLGGDVTYRIAIGNTGANPVTDKAYNLTITDTLPVGLTYQSASIQPTSLQPQTDGTTILIWDNIVDVEVNEILELDVTAVLSAGLTMADSFENSIVIAANTIPDNSGEWLAKTSTLAARPQAIDIELAAHQSTGDEQATGAGEYDGGADWPFRYTATVRNNNVGSTEHVTATLLLPPNLAYLGNPTVSNGASATPQLALQADGSLEMQWALGTLTTADYTTPVEITFDVAIPYRARTSADVAAEAGAFAGIMSGDIIPEDAEVAVSYEAIGSYDGSGTADGTQSTPADDAVEIVVAEYLTISKSVSPTIVGIGTEVTYDLHYFVSEYYTTTNVTLVDVLPDGMTYVDGSATVAPLTVETDTPTVGKTTLTWALPTNATIPGSDDVIRFNATVDEIYSAAPLTNEPIVSGDSLTNDVTISGDWQDAITVGRFGTAIPDTSDATVTTRFTTFSKDVYDVESATWGANTVGFTGDEITFRLQYASASNVDAKEIIIRDFLPRGMSFVNGSDTYQMSGNFSDSSGCTSAPQTPTIGMLNGLQYLEWSLCSVEQASSWQVELKAKVSDIPDAQPGWIVANFGKLSGQNSYGKAYSLRELATVDYNAPELVLVKTANPAQNLSANDTIDYTIAVTNRGKATAYNLVLTDVVPANLIVPNSGGSATPTDSSYTSSGNPAAGNGGTLTWAAVAELAAGETQTFRYVATVKAGVIAGESMTNLATIGYNSRSDNTGHQWVANSDVSELNTDDETVYVRGATLSKSADTTNATIGDTVTWTLVGTVPAGVVAHWPVIEENDLPNGFDFVEGSTLLTNALLDTDNHTENPIDNDNRDVRWFLQTIDNTAGSSDYVFTLEFETVVTGLRPNGTNAYACCRKNADNDAFIGWYDDATGYNGTGYASESYNTNQIDRRSPEADADVKVIQPQLSVTKSTDYNTLGANGIALFTIQVRNNGNATAYDMTLVDDLPVGLTLQQTVSQSIIGNSSGATFIDGNLAGDGELAYGLNMLRAGDTWEVRFSVRVPADISADLEFQNIATVTTYSSQPGSHPFERTYDPVSGSVQLYTPSSGISKSAAVADELTYDSEIIYTVIVPAQPVPATMYNVVVSDLVDERLTVTDVSNGSHNGNNVSASFASIAPNQQETITIRATLPVDSDVKAGEIIRNQASRVFDNAPVVQSNEVANTIVAPALVVEKSADKPFVNVGDTINYTVNIKNVANGRADNVVLADQLPATFTLVPGSVKLNGIVINVPALGGWELPALAGNTTHVVTYQTTALAPVAGVAYDNVATVTAVDSNGNVVPVDNSAVVAADSDPSDQATARVYGPLTCTNEDLSIAYEDLKNVGWSDWDYNDVLIRIDIEQCVTPTGNLAVLQNRYEIVARGAGYDHEFRHALPVVGGGRYGLTVMNPDGSVAKTAGDTFAELADFSIFGRTWEALPPLSGFTEPFVNTRPEQDYFVPGQVANLTIVLDEPENNPASFLPPVPFDPYINVYNTGESVHLNIPGHLDNTQSVSGIFDPSTPLLGFDLPLAHTFDVNIDWPLEQFGIWRGYPLYEDFIKSGGATALDWDDLNNAEQTYLWQYAPNVPLEELLNSRSVRDTSGDSSYFASPIVVDSRIVIGNQLTNQLEVYDLNQKLLWSVDVGGAIRAAAVAADLNGDGTSEILVGSGNGTLHAFHANGQTVSGWPVQVGTHRVLATPAVAQLQGSTAIIIPLADGRLYAFNADGTPRWNVSMGDVTDEFSSQTHNSSPTIADIDGNGTLEIVVGSQDKKLYVFNADGSLKWAFETADPIFGQPIVADIDPTRTGLEIAFGSSQLVAGYARSFLFVLDKDGSVVQELFAGWSGLRGTALVADIDENGDLELLIGSGDGNVRAWQHGGEPVAGWPQATDGAITAQPKLGDVDGDGTNEIIVASEDAHIYAYEVDGTLVDNWPRETSVSVTGTPIVANLDGDVAAEVIVGDLGGELYFWDVQVEFKLFLPTIRR